MIGTAHAPLLDAALGESVFSAPLLGRQTRDPHHYLTPSAGAYPLGSIRTIHAASLFSGGAVVDGEVHQTVRQDFEAARDAGVTALYVIGMWESTAFSKLWTEHWLPTWGLKDTVNPRFVGASVFSAEDYVPNHLIGSWDNLDRVLACAAEVGITIIPCFITNTIGMGGSLHRRTLREQPQSLMYRGEDRSELERLMCSLEKNTPEKVYSESREGGPSAGHHSLQLFRHAWQHDLYRYIYEGITGERFTALLQIRDHKLLKHSWIIERASPTANEGVHCVQLGSEDPFDQGDGSATVWSDTVHRSVHLPETRVQQMRELHDALSRFRVFRCDMAHLAGVPAWSDYPRIVDELGHQVDRMLLETYFEHGPLQKQHPSISTYADYIYKWLVRDGMNIPALMSHIHDDRSMYEGHRNVAYVENHDDVGDKDLARRGAQALIITACPVESVLWSQNQRYGDPFRIGAQWHIPRQQIIANIDALLRGEGGHGHPTAHADFHAFFSRVEKLSALPVFRDPKSQWRRAVFTAEPEGESDRIFHIVREFQHPKFGVTDRALVVVDARHTKVGFPVHIDVAATFQIEPEQLSNYKIVDLIDGAVSSATEELMLVPDPGSPEPHSYAVALVSNDLWRAPVSGA